MPFLTRRNWLLGAARVGVVPLLPAALTRVQAQAPQVQVVRLVAERFRYTPAEFRVRAGVPVVLEFSARDFVHGFSLPDLKLRADLPPGTVTRLAFTPAQPGNYEFLCDNFCGEGHERMQGRMIVEGGG